MKIKASMVFRGACTGLLVAALIAALPAAIDWYHNPGGIFRAGAGTQWVIVFETWWSWFWPAALVLVPLTLTFYVWRLGRRAEGSA